MLSDTPALTNDAVWTLLRTSAKPFPGDCSQCGAGLLDATLAVNAAINYGAQNRIDQNEFFVQQLYLDVLKRTSDPDGLAFWVNVLNTCNGGATCLKSTRTAIARAFLESPENQAQQPTLNPASQNYKSDFVIHCYTDFLQRGYDIAGVLNHYQYLVATGDFDTVVNSFITSPEYRARFGAP
jgi:serine protease